MREKDIARLGGTSAVVTLSEGEAFGAPLRIDGVAALLGCSHWTVRHRLIPRGLPHWRTSRNGTYLFYRGQVQSWWWRQRQQKGG
jgi:excisionase family DNA binding protein